MMKLRPIALIALFSQLFFPSLSFSQDQHSKGIEQVSQSPKLLRSEVLMQPFEEGADKIRVIVNLRKPQRANGLKNLKQRAVRKDLRQIVKNSQERLLDALPSNEVKVTNRFHYL